MNNAVFGFNCYMHCGYIFSRITQAVTIAHIASVHRSLANTNTVIIKQTLKWNKSL
jgi:hypothetical protein